VSHRDIKPSDFEGKTVARVDARAVNMVLFWFTDGSTLALEHERDGITVCDECAPAPMTRGKAWWKGFRDGMSAGPLWRWLGGVRKPLRLP